MLVFLDNLSVDNFSFNDFWTWQFLNMAVILYYPTYNSRLLCVCGGGGEGGSNSKHIHCPSVLHCFLKLCLVFVRYRFHKVKHALIKDTTFIYTSEGECVKMTICLAQNKTSLNLIVHLTNCMYWVYSD